jgi:hypothetical protein
MNRCAMGAERTVAVAAVIAVASLLGCGGGSGQCGGNVSCGGDIVGTWDITTSCVNQSALMSDQSCPGATIDASGLKETGAITFSSDGTYSVMFAVSGSLAESIPLSCFTSGGTSLTCDQFEAAYQAAIQESDVLSGVSCQSAPGRCNCTFPYKGQTMTESGTYTTSGGTLTSAKTGGTADSARYCVEGSTLTVASSTMANMDSIATQITLTRR